MVTYQIYVQDSRYAVPTLYFVDAANKARIVKLATRKLLENDCHLGVEVRQGDTLVLRTGSRILEPNAYSLFGRVAIPASGSDV